MSDNSESLEICAEVIEQADGLLITAGAGMGADSGLPTFRGNEGFWKAYPRLGANGLSFYDIASPSAFEREPRLAWGFYGHRLNMYRMTEPHQGFALLRDFAKPMPNGLFVFTSNVDGQFQKAGYSESQITEVHGSLHHLQCVNTCTQEVWSADGFVPQVDEIECQLLNEPPRCPTCGALARPNVLMFEDAYWNDARAQNQASKFETWRKNVDRLLVIEIGAGPDIPTVRRFGEFHADFLIRINLNDEVIPSGCRGLGLKMHGLDALNAISKALGY